MLHGSARQAPRSARTSSSRAAGDQGSTKIGRGESREAEIIVGVDAVAQVDKERARARRASESDIRFCHEWLTWRTAVVCACGCEHRLTTNPVKLRVFTLDGIPFLTAGRLEKQLKSVVAAQSVLVPHGSESARVLTSECRSTRAAPLRFLVLFQCVNVTLLFSISSSQF